MPSRRATLLAPLALLLPATARAQPAAVPVVASFSVLADMVQTIAGPTIALTSTVPAGRDAHGFQPRPTDQRQVQAARLVLANGLGFDPWMDRLVRSANFRGPYVKAAEGVTARTMLVTHGHAHGGGSLQRHAARTVTDPHAWQDLGNAPVYARNIAAGLKRALPAAEHQGIDARAAKFVQDAATTDAWVRALLATVPPERRRVITGHDAFGYFGAAYGVAFLAPQGVSTESEPSAAEVARLIRLIRDSGIRAVFMENMGNPRLIEQIARDAGVRLGGTLYADALSPPGGPADTWLGMFRHNVPLMVEAMGQ
jgi:zinc/manganese transport system substrate-binding protein